MRGAPGFASLIPRRSSRRRRGRVTFDLLREPWLPVLPLDSDHITQVSLVDLVLNAHRHRRLVGSSPTMTAALHRLVLALLHRAFTPDDDDWDELWMADPAHLLDEEDEFRRRLDRYVERTEPRFDLFDAHRPFLQCPDLARRPSWNPAKDAEPHQSTAVLVAPWATGNNRTLFDHTTATERPELSPAEAARWLVTLQAYDTGGQKTGYEKSPASSQTSLGSYFGCALLEGDTLRRTLLLNLVAYRPDEGRPTGTGPADRPAWEDDEVHRPDPGPPRPPRGLTDALTWPSRRVLLFRGREAAGASVVGVLRTPGTRLDGDLSQDVEPMAAFRERWISDSKPARTVPVRLEGVRGVWQYTQELLLPEVARWSRSGRKYQGKAGEKKLASKNKLVPSLVPGAEPARLRPLAVSRVDGSHVIPDSTVFTLRVFGQELGKNGGNIVAWYEEEVPAPVALMRARDRRIGYVIGEAVAYADNLGNALRVMETTYRQSFAPPSSGRRGKPSAALRRAALEIDFWPRVAEPFNELVRRLGVSVGSDAEIEQAATEWADVVHGTAGRAARRWAEDVGRRDRELLAAGESYTHYLRAATWLRDRHRENLAQYTEVS
ncbi:type I-E CRISPR-associated protein Cse1/CasA [Streptomyces jumonjinensis]|uniref:type I-E CRISPR-associated protein Cse1/CasA n=1 Tax=Streptomyces jumonjinensis TaxID=1945 RepID=UPI0018865118|nr:type I-E CRISPR-associated protein Cse1/CasA [Streptomyces jumonjinensis]